MQRKKSGRERERETKRKTNRFVAILKIDLKHCWRQETGRKTTIRKDKEWEKEERILKKREKEKQQKSRNMSEKHLEKTIKLFFYFGNVCFITGIVGKIRREGEGGREEEGQTVSDEHHKQLRKTMIVTGTSTDLTHHLCTVHVPLSLPLFL